jgi:aldose sugar dehydrogenase
MRIRLVALTLVAGFALHAQQPGPNAGLGRGPGRAPTAPPPITWNSPPLPEGPIVLDTAIQHQIRLTVTKGLSHPFSMAFLPNGAILVTERPGRLRIVRNGVLDPTPVAGLPQIRAQGLGGLLDLALHPRFAENKLIYFTYDKPAATGNMAVRTLARGRWDGTALVEVRDLFSAIPSGNASRILFGRDV